MGGMCNTHVRDRKCIQSFNQKENWREKNHMGVLDVDENVILKCIL
jgi:hypothetical protein